MTKSTPDYSLHTGAKGGGQLGRTRNFLKESDGADQRAGGTPAYKNPAGTSENYGVQGADTVFKGDGVQGKQIMRTGDKCLPTIKPRS